MDMRTSMSFLLIIIQISILIRQSASVAMDDLTPFGEDNGDVLMHSKLDAVSGKINITTAFPFFGRNFTSLYVSSHGLISLEKAFAKYVPKPFPLPNMVTIIAPYWADVAQRNKGGIWYRQNSTKHLLEVASIDVRNAFLEFPHFSAIWMFVTTWEKVTFYQSTNKNITNTFQLVLLTDCRYSFISFKYHEISWTSATTSGGNSSNGLGGNEAGSGFNAGFGNRSYNVTWNSFRNISVLDLPFKTNVGKPGMWIFRTDDITIQEPKRPTTKEILLSPSIDLEELIPFGKNNGDILLPPGDDYESSGKIDITTTFPFFGQNFTSLYVIINGLISFQKLFVSFKPKPFPLGDHAIIAPFWADVDTRKGGAIWYRQNATKHLLEEASIDVRKAFPEFPLFSAIWMFVATWEKVPFFKNKNENITNTFQTALLTDGRYSFVRFNYHNITWTSAQSSGGDPNSGLGGTEAMCGFNAGFGSYYYDITRNGYRNISVLDLGVESNVNKSRVWLFRTDGITIQEANLSRHLFGHTFQ